MDELMNVSHYETQFWKVLAKGDLVDLSQFHKPSTCDEVPLYSRDADIAFLPSDVATRDKILLTLSLKFLNAVMAYDEHRTPYFAALTVWNPTDDAIVPNLFVWNTGVEELYDKLELNDVKSRFGKTMKKYLSQVPTNDLMTLAEDTATVPNMTRVFIGPQIRPYKGFVPLRSFYKPAVSSEA